MTADEVRRLLIEEYNWDVEEMARDRHLTVREVTGLLQHGSVPGPSPAASSVPVNSIDDPAKRQEMICKAFATTRRGVYDGKNVYAPKVGVCVEGDKYFFSSPGKIKAPAKFLFYPSTEEILAVLEEYKQKGWHPYYDTDVCEYGYVGDKSEIRGRAAILDTRWL